MIASTITAIVATVFKPFCRFVAKLSPNVKKFVQPSLSAAKAFTEQNVFSDLFYFHKMTPFLFSVFYAAYYMKPTSDGLHSSCVL